MTERVSNHYDTDYFSWQSSMGEFGGWANITKFQAYISGTDDVLDFGCGGGYLLKNIACGRRVGVEVNPDAIQTAIKNGLEIFEEAKAVPDDHVDVIISDNALEHALNPLQELRDLFPKVRKGGLLVFVVPCESISYAYRPDDINHHLFGWSPMCLGNLITEAGFSLVESKPYIHKWPPKYQLFARIGGRRVFDVACRLYGRIERSWFQVRAVARRPQT